MFYRPRLGRICIGDKATRLAEPRGSNVTCPPHRFTDRPRVESCSMSNLLVQRIYRLYSLNPPTREVAPALLVWHKGRTNRRVGAARRAQLTEAAPTVLARGRNSQKNDACLPSRGRILQDHMRENSGRNAGHGTAMYMLPPSIPTLLIRDSQRLL